MIRLLENHLRTCRGMKLIEFGTGHIELVHYDLAESNELTVSDIKRIDKYDVNVGLFDLLIADACNTGLKDSSFDAAFSSMLIPYIDICRHFKEVRRILRENGKYWFACTGNYHNIEISEPSLQRINMNKGQLEMEGASLIKEELFYEHYSKDEMMRYLGDIGVADNKFNNYAEYSLTKHYLLFELSK